LNRIWMPVTAGILDVICGISGILSGYVFLAIGAGFASGSVSDPLATCIGVLTIIAAVLAIIGSYFTFMRKRWSRVLIGAIAALGTSIPWLFAFWSDFNDFDDLFGIAALFNLTIIPGIVAIILTVLSRKRFERK